MRNRALTPTKRRRESAARGILSKLRSLYIYGFRIAPRDAGYRQGGMCTRFAQQAMHFKANKRYLI